MDSPAAASGRRAGGFFVGERAGEGARGTAAARLPARRPRAALRRLAAACGLCLAGSVAAPAASLAQGVIIQGTACVVDGDTLVIGEANTVGRCRQGHAVSLFGIDAPEADQTCRRPDGDIRWPCGEEAVRALRALVEGERVDCRGRGERLRGRDLVRCYRGGIDLGQRMVREGWALARRQHTNQYVGDETQARANRLGIWSGRFIEPERWRRGER
jgi:endonuclease YncB( thermonuclease family)